MLSLKVKNFYLMRHVDLNGLSGTGVVAVGSVFPHGPAHMYWTSFKRSLEIHDSVEALIDIHGHNGATELIYGDPPGSEDEKPAKKTRKKKSREQE